MVSGLWSISMFGVGKWSKGVKLGKWLPDGDGRLGILEGPGGGQLRRDSKLELVVVRLQVNMYDDPHRDSNGRGFCDDGYSTHETYGDQDIM
ncbi:hypothetical protein ACH5RR_000688 [Cinchona calisaya]|uniref:Uncharacterized protein n=1 Tax=Cinchona calisaya TaxID=153742 RepID=A0ABD3B1A4_9GENT